MTVEINESKRRIQNLSEKAAFMEQKLEDLVVEANMHKERVDSMLEENRRILTESGILQKSIDNQKTMIEVLEKQKANLERELIKYTKVSAKSNLTNAEVHQKKAVQEISEDGVNKMRQMYEHNMKTKATMTQIRGLKNKVVVERNWEEERDYIMRKIPVRNFETQTVDLT